MLGGRVASGAALAALPLAVALVGGTQESTFWCWATWLAAAAVVLVLALTAAPWAPILNRLPPPVGSPKAEVSLREIPSTDHRYPPQVVILEAAVRPTTRLNDAVVKLRFPRGAFMLDFVDSAGESWREPIMPLGEASPERWWTKKLDLQVAGMVMYFRLVFGTEPKDVVVHFSVTSELLYSQASTQAVVHYRPGTSASSAGAEQ